MEKIVSADTANVNKHFFINNQFLNSYYNKLFFNFFCFGFDYNEYLQN